MKKRKMKKIILWTAVVLICAFAASGTCAVFQYRACAYSPGGAEILKTDSSASGPVLIGKSVVVSVRFRTPWARTFVLPPEIVPGKGSQTGTAPEVRLNKLGWGWSEHTLTFSVQPYRDGKIEGGIFSLEILGGTDGKQILSGDIPAFTAEAEKLSPGDKLEIAGKIDPVRLAAEARKKWLVVFFAILALVLAAFLIWLFRRKRHGESVLPPWEIALAGISEVRSGIAKGFFNAESATVRLTDIVRVYLEARFQLRAAHQTTREFLSDLERGNFLAENQRRFLRDFLRAADLVKFARVPASLERFDEAAGNAAKLIDETAVREKKTDGGGTKS